MNLKGDARIQKDNAGNLPRAHRMPSVTQMCPELCPEQTQQHILRNKQRVFYYMCILKTKTKKPHKDGTHK